MQKWLAGKKTYLVALAAILAAGIAWVSGELTNVQTVEAIVAAVIAATMRAGVAKGEVRRAILPFAVGSLLLMGGCSANMSNGQKYIITCQTYATTANTVATLVRAGEFGAADKMRIRALNDTCKALILKMRDDLAGNATSFTFDYTLRQFQTVLDELLRLQLQAEVVLPMKENARGPNNADTDRTNSGPEYRIVTVEGRSGVATDGQSANPGRNRGCHPSGIGGPRQPRRRAEWRPAYPDPAIASGRAEREWD